MGIYIKNMKMPSACAFCDFGKRLDNFWTFCTRKPMEKPVEDGNGRPDYCPFNEMTLRED